MSACICGPGTRDPACEAHSAAASRALDAQYAEEQAARETLRATRSLRRRANIKSTSKGDLSFDVTVDGTGYSEDELCEFTLSLAARFQVICHPAIRYPELEGDNIKTNLTDLLQVSIEAEKAKAQPPEAMP